MPSSVPHMDPHPRPQLERDGWVSLNGRWDFAIDAESAYGNPNDIVWDRQIKVPFAPECQASEVDFNGYFRACWYRRRFRAPILQKGERLILHFGAVDYEATVWVNGHLVARHQGGSTPFHCDIVEALLDDGVEFQTIIVRAEDDPHDLAKPRGKQDWQLEPHSIWYARTSGIWQTVWLEQVPRSSIGYLRWTPTVERWEIGLDVRLNGLQRDGMRLAVRLLAGDTVLADDVYTVVAGEVHRRISLSDPGIDDYRNELLWTPAKPTLIHAELQLFDSDGQRIDLVRSYTALRSISIQGDRFVLNG